MKLKLDELNYFKAETSNERCFNDKSSCPICFWMFNRLSLTIVCNSLKLLITLKFVMILLDFSWIQKFKTHFLSLHHIFNEYYSYKSISMTSSVRSFRMSK